MIVESFLLFLSKVFCFTSFISNGNSFPTPLTAEEEKMYLEQTKAGDLAAREILVRHNLRLVAHIVKKFSGAGEADDLISVGSIGLIKGIESFEYGKGSQLATYCARCIENEILMYIRANKKHKSTISLIESVGSDKDGNEITLMDILPGDGEKLFLEVEDQIVYRQIVQTIERELEPREKRIIKLRYGIGYSRTYTQLEVADMLKISRSYVSRIEKKAINRLREIFMGKIT